LEQELRMMCQSIRLVQPTSMVFQAMMKQINHPKELLEGISNL